MLVFIADSGHSLSDVAATYQETEEWKDQQVRCQVPQSELHSLRANQPKKRINKQGKEIFFTGKIKYLIATYVQAVFGELEEGAVYLFRVKAHTTKGSGPWSDVASFTVDRDVLRSPLAVNAVATSDTSVEVWWEAVPNRGKVIGYQVWWSDWVCRTFSWSINLQIFYTMTAVEDLDAWSHKIVGLTESIELVNLEKFAQYAVAVAARTKTVSLDLKAAVPQLIWSFFNRVLVVCLRKSLWR